MELTDLLTSAVPVGSVCDKVYSGFEEVYLVPIGDGFKSIFLPEVITELPTIDEIPQKMILEPESARLRSQQKVSDLGEMFTNTFTINSIRNISNWIFENRFRKFWLLLKQDGRWMVTGDDDMPYMIVADFDSGKQMNESQDWAITLVGDQLRPYHLLPDSTDPPEEDDGGDDGDPDPSPD